MTFPDPPPPAEQATGPGWPGEDPDRDALLSQDPTETYQGGGLARVSVETADDGIVV